VFEMPPGLTVSNMTVRYGGVVANDRVSLSVAPGEIVGLIGPNGAGKTTLVDAVTGFTPATGTIHLDGQPIEHLLPFRRRRCGLARTWQAGELFGNLTVEENVLAALGTGGLRGVWSDLVGRKSDRADQVKRALETVGLIDLSGRRAGSLPLGRQKLVGVARALVGATKVLLLDEPAAGLDSREGDQFAECLSAINSLGIATLLIEHDMGLVFKVCTRVYVMDFGRVIASGRSEDVRSMPAVTAAYLGDSTALET
jgi:branched-chain amino acid transport system ATP-binding protein